MSCECEDCKCAKEQDRLIEDNVFSKTVFTGPVEFKDTITIPLDKIVYQFGNSGPIAYSDANTMSWKPYTIDMNINYKFMEGHWIDQVQKYIDSTYQKHYSGKYQATDMIIDAGHGTGFNIGNIMKYAKRYGKKGGYNKDDLMKIIHYAIIQLHVHEVEGLEDMKGSE